MTKDEYILRSLSKIAHKPWELLVVSRIIHGIIGLDVEFICQQHVRRPDNGRALTDLFLPQFKVHLEVDECHHFEAEAMSNDTVRSRDVIDATGHRLERIICYTELRPKECVDKPISEVIKATDEFLKMVIDERNKQTRDGDFRPWEFNARFDPNRFIGIGQLDVNDGPAFRTHQDAQRCFGYSGGHNYRGYWRVPDGTNRMLWFPKLYRSASWNNSLSADGLTITEIALDGHDHPEVWAGRIVFAHYTDELGITLYRFLGYFVRDEDSSNGEQNGTKIYRRQSSVVCLPEPRVDNV